MEHNLPWVVIGVAEKKETLDDVLESIPMIEYIPAKAYKKYNEKQAKIKADAKQFEDTMRDIPTIQFTPR